MPLHRTGLVSRYQLDHPDEKSPQPVVAPTYDHVLKYNPNHGPDGRFTAGAGGRPGGTMGTPVTGAFGQSLGSAKRSKPAASRFDTGGGFTPGKSWAAHQAARTVPTQRTMDTGYLRQNTFTGDPNFNSGVGDAELAGSSPYKHTTLRYR